MNNNITAHSQDLPNFGVYLTGQFIATQSKEGNFLGIKPQHVLAGSEIFKIADFGFLNIDISFSTKESFYIIAIKNLRKKINYLHLNYEFQNGDITEDEFEKEINENPQKYVVNVTMLKNIADFKTINEIINKVDDNLTIDEIPEIFSVDISNISNQLPLELS